MATRLGNMPNGWDYATAGRGVSWDTRGKSMAGLLLNHAVSTTQFLAMKASKRTWLFLAVWSTSPPRLGGFYLKLAANIISRFRNVRASSFGKHPPKRSFRLLRRRAGIDRHGQHASMSQLLHS